MSYMGLLPLMTEYCDSLHKWAVKETGESHRVQILEIGVDRGQTSLPLMHNLICRGIPFDWIGIDIRQDHSFMQQLILMEGVEPDFIDGASEKSKAYYITNNSLNVLGKFHWHFDLVLLDGDHNYDTVKEELSHLSRITNDASLVICDDYGGKHKDKDAFYKNNDLHKTLENISDHLDLRANKGGVTRAVDEFLKTNQGWLDWMPFIDGDPIVMSRLPIVRKWEPFKKVTFKGSNGRTACHPEDFDAEFDFSSIKILPAEP